ncbi:MAG: hypothetical protein Fur0034_03900 [Desulfuromonadia bacterium]
MSGSTFDPAEFTLRGDDDFLRVDSLCHSLLREFHHALVASGGVPVEATERARSADLFVRDFVVDHLQENPFMIDGVTVVRFAASWYVTSAAEPNMKELAIHLKGVEAFARYLHECGHMDSARLHRIVAAAADLPYYESRLDSYWELTAAEYRRWLDEPLLRRKGDE